MKIYVQEQKVTLVGKAWQINYMLKKYMKKYTTVQEWIDSQRPKHS
ncbi:Z-ring formation inhibitor MciZ [Anaerobacillus isosaccharinicus]|uniref:PadR family transcriptional regulator n=1 Tax=Anaerobacillus isosaccharinicus TaxID=1532552 RepID=A0A1S2L9W2_9BACI|nr:Z-ring formation inhibitor MciZ [Anaerobacillus isosaccharinicus]MBA5585729.1 Z-ring formation inhibitor MciZ [Anaerobacillus isosaccharinicus]QOY35965.1 Z-ring formation inhibitor MciZ [Anaerobacillus isosaccharinicus]